MTSFKLPDTEEAIRRLDLLMAEAFGTDHPAMHDWVAVRFALQERSQYVSSGWIPVHERLPDCTYHGIRSDTVFVLRDGKATTGQAAFEGGKFHSWCAPEGEVTHWMPIPKLSFISGGQE